RRPRRRAGTEGGPRSMRDARRGRQALLDLGQLRRHLAQRLAQALVAQLLALLDEAQGLRELAGDGRLELEQLPLHRVEPARQLLELLFRALRGHVVLVGRYYRKSREEVGKAGRPAERTATARTDTPPVTCRQPSTSSPFSSPSAVASRPETA